MGGGRVRKGTQAEQVRDTDSNVKSIESLADLTQDPQNCRRHNPRNIGSIVSSLHAVGAARSIVIDESGVILAGNGMVEAAGVAGIQRVKVVEADGNTIIAVRRTGLTAGQKAELAIRDNRTAELAEWDAEQLLKTVAEYQLDIAGLEFNEQEVAALTVEAEGEKDVEQDDVPTDFEKRCKAGDLWQLGTHRLLCGDSTKAEDVGRVMTERAELLFTSPPYSDIRDYQNAVDLSPESLAKFISAFATRASYQVVNLGMKRVDGEVSEYWQAYINAAHSIGLKLLSWNVWNREQCGYSVGAITAMFAIQHEFIFVFGQKAKKLNLTVPNKEAGLLNTHIGQRQADGTTKKQDDVTIRSHRQLGTVQTIGTQLARNEGVDHPAMMPVALPAVYISAMTTEGEVIADPFLGSGTTIVAAEQLGRRCFGLEISPEYCDVIICRWERLTGNKATKI